MAQRESTLKEVAGLGEDKSQHRLGNPSVTKPTFEPRSQRRIFNEFDNRLRTVTTPPPTSSPEYESTKNPGRRVSSRASLWPIWQMRVRTNYGSSIDEFTFTKNANVICLTVNDPSISWLTPEIIEDLFIPLRRRLPVVPDTDKIPMVVVVSSARTDFSISDSDVDQLVYPNRVIAINQLGACAFLQSITVTAYFGEISRPTLGDQELKNWLKHSE
ncbi:MAG: hypothetical protein LQ344_000893 [Seirophora lacunosa]|nr:MAG: hypothetical protein LQ344_000893 [Seirophora lacunosa]